MTFIMLLFSYSHKCSTLVSIRTTPNKKPKPGLSKCEWLDKFKAAKHFPVNYCIDIRRKDFTESFKKFFKAATFEIANINAKDAGFSLNHVLSYYDILKFICEKFDEHYQALQTNQPNTPGWP